MEKSEENYQIVHEQKIDLDQRYRRPSAIINFY